MSNKLNTYIVFRLNTYFGMCRKDAGPINSKATLRVRLPTVTNAGPHCGCVEIRIIEHKQIYIYIYVCVCVRVRVRVRARARARVCVYMCAVFEITTDSWGSPINLIFRQCNGY